METFKVITDPAAEEKIRDLVALYLDPPATQVQALNRTQPLSVGPAIRGLTSWPSPRQVARHYPGGLHLILGNASGHKTPAVQAGLAAHPRVHFPFTPTGAPWMNVIEAWFSVLTRKSIRRGSFDSVRALVRHIQAYLDHWSEHPVPFTWTKTADQTIAKALRH